MGNCSGKNNRSEKKYIKRKGHHAGMPRLLLLLYCCFNLTNVDVDGPTAINDFNQTPGARSDKYNQNAQDDGIATILNLKLNEIDYINYISPLEDSTMYLIAVNKEVKVIDTLTGAIEQTYEHPK
jgi:hypothetical protein